MVLSETDFQKALGELNDSLLKLLRRQFSNGTDIWNIEYAIIEFQIRRRREIERTREIESRTNQEIIELAKTKEQNWKAEITARQSIVKNCELRQEQERKLWVASKRLADALAFLIFPSLPELLNLSNNHPNSPVRGDETFHGVLGAAQLFCEKLAVGFPFIHDISNILRIGDISLIKPGHAPITFEVKTRVTGQDANGTSLEVTAISMLDAAQGKRLNTILESHPENRKSDTVTSGSQSQPAGNTRRLARQLDRMTKASLAREDQAAWDTEQTKHLRVHIDPDSSDHHWDAAKTVLQEARLYGVAFRSADRATVYIGVGSSSSLLNPNADRSFMDKLSPDRVGPALVESGIWDADADKNFPWLYSSLEHFSDEPPLYALPPHLHPFDESLVLDLVSGKVALFTMVNVGRLVAALQEAGISAKVADKLERRQGKYICARVPVECADGRPGTISFIERGMHLKLIACEYLSVGGFVRRVKESLSKTADSLGVKLLPFRIGG